MKILLVRHAEPDYAIDSLTPKGKREAELLSHRLAKLTDVEAVYCSPLGRARDTAAYTLEKTGWNCEILPWLQEFRGRAFDEKTGEPYTAHTVGKVQAVLYNDDASVKSMKEGKLADIAPTLLELLDIAKPQEMNGNSLLVK